MYRCVYLFKYSRNQSFPEVKTIRSNEKQFRASKTVSDTVTEMVVDKNNL